MAVKVLIDRRLVLGSGQFVAIMKAFVVPKSKKFPLGIKAKFLLLDVEAGMPKLLVDNHEPYGFHIHSKMTKDPTHRHLLEAEDYREAMEIFLKEAKRIINNEEI